ncbi:TetR/AcrR family transcriptional regulator [Amycolatopsis sp. CA-230715]|uniref:TetR/AcrR family transcriptional regulator n=1 Tax=Amycolatopsis sp. CA-230715 TaxID=2745196 RepID=UPI001C02C4E8|nr:TetR/AcrR family transcriptional regulator C-terminal domain-containing protein [Amycolatopsis sp. CA-230715]QWF78283.1 hypothetical protein HUW46_01678 [Amycolatopsis sp. CA-230715]
MASTAPGPSRPRSRSAAGLPAVTPDRVIEAALRLTADNGLESWTLRQLAAAVDAYPAVIYHHVGDRETVARAVVDRVTAMFPLPSGDLTWRRWWEELLPGLREVLRQYPGVARRLSLFGPTAEVAGRTVDTGMRLLLDAGFGEESMMVYSLLIGTAFQLVAVEDDRMGDELTRQRYGRDWQAERGNTGMPGLAAMGKAVHDILESGRDYLSEMYDFTVERCLDGVEARLGALTSGPSPLRTDVTEV